MKDKENIGNDREFVADRINSENISLSEKLSKENITELVSGKKQKTPVKTTVKRIVSVAVAACIVICSLAVVDRAFINPKPAITQDNSSEVVFAADYAQLSEIISAYKEEQKNSDRVNLFSSVFTEKSSDAASADTAPAAGYGAREERVTVSNAESVNEDNGAYDAAASSDSAEYSETNLREAGIEEADVVKTDGEYIYALCESVIYIVKPEDNDAAVVGKIEKPEDRLEEDGVQGFYSYYYDFYLYNDKIIVEKSESAFFEDTEANAEYKDLKDTAGIEIYDISNKAEPEYIRSVTFEGYRVSSRIIGNQLLYISNYNIDMYSDSYSADDYKTFVPANYCDSDVCYPEAADIAIVNTSSPDTYLTVAKLDLDDNESKPQTVSLFGSGDDIYCTNSTLYVFNTNYNYGYYSSTLLDTVADYIADSVNNEATATEGSAEITTNIISFDITGEAPTVKAKGCIDGYMTDTWSADEYNGYLRVASTNEETFIYVLDGELKLVGKSEGMAKGEWVESVRFSGDVAYVVTFYTTDPLFVVDLSEPASPKVAGELKLPGFSAYLHPAGDGLLLGVGVGGDDEGTDGSAKLSLFDVSNPLEPKEVSSYKLEDGDFTATYDYKSFVSVGDGTYIIPYTRYDTKITQNGSDIEYNYDDYFGAVRIKTENGEIEIVARYEISNDACGGYEPRAMFINDTVYVLTVSCEVYFTAWNIDSGEMLYGKAISK